MEKNMMLFYSLSPLLLGLILISCIATKEILKDTRPDLLLRLHVFWFKRGKYRMEKVYKEYRIKNMFGSINFSYLFAVGEPDNYSVSSSMGFRAFSFKYDLKDSRIYNFECSDTFAKNMKPEKFIEIMREYIPLALKNTSGFKNAKDIASELIEGTILTPPVSEFNEFKEPNLEININPGLPKNIREPLKGISLKLEEIKKNIDKFDVEEKYSLYKLIDKRLPSFLSRYESLSENEKQIEENTLLEIIDSISVKMDNLLDVTSNETINEYEREKILIKNMI